MFEQTWSVTMFQKQSYGTPLYQVQEGLSSHHVAEVMQTWAITWELMCQTSFKRSLKLQSQLVAEQACQDWQGEESGWLQISKGTQQATGSLCQLSMLWEVCKVLSGSRGASQTETGRAMSMCLPGISTLDNYLSTPSLLSYLLQGLELSSGMCSLGLLLQRVTSGTHQCCSQQGCERSSRWHLPVDPIPT